MVHILIKGGKDNTHRSYVASYCNMCTGYTSISVPGNRGYRTVICNPATLAHGSTVVSYNNSDGTNAPWNLTCKGYTMSEDVPQLVKAVNVLAHTNREFTIVEDKKSKAP